MMIETHSETILPGGEFSLRALGDGPSSEAELTHKGRRVAPVTARSIDAQFRLPDGCTLVFASDDTAFAEMLTILLVGPDLRVRDSVKIGGATTPGFLAYAEAHGDGRIAFCWHDHEQVVTVKRRNRWFGLRHTWLRVQDLMPQRTG